MLLLNCFLDKTLSSMQTYWLQTSSLTACQHKHICTHKRDAKYASGMNVSYLKLFEKKYSFGFEVSENSHDLLLCFKSIMSYSDAHSYHFECKSQRIFFQNSILMTLTSLRECETCQKLLIFLWTCTGCHLFDIIIFV